MFVTAVCFRFLLNPTTFLLLWKEQFSTTLHLNERVVNLSTQKNELELA